MATNVSVEADRKIVHPNSDNNTDFKNMICYLFDKVQKLEKKNTVLHDLWLKSREETEKQTELLRNTEGIL